MKLLLTSFGWKENKAIGNQFLKLVNKKPSEIKVLSVMTPAKYPRRNVYIKSLKAIGILEKNVIIFKLDKKANANTTKYVDVIFVNGGNTFDYLNRIRTTGFNKLIKNFIKKGGVYVGLSAGSYIVSPTIEAAGWKHADQNKIKLKNLKGLNLVPFLITAHFEYKWRSVIKNASMITKFPIIAITDKQAILVIDKSIKIIGSGAKNTFNMPRDLILL